MLSTRIAHLLDRARRLRRGSDPDGYLYGESYAMTAGEPEVLRAAKAAVHYFAHCSLVIHDHELIVGDQRTDEPDGAPVVTRPQAFGHQSFTCPWPVSDDLQNYFRRGVLAGAGNHTTMDYVAIFKDGFNGLIARIERRLTNLQQERGLDKGQEYFLVALRILAQAYIGFCRRYGDRADDMARGEDDASRRRELETIAANCRRVIAEPPTTFWQACQCAWFSFFFLADAPGRVDQYLYPFYKADIERGSLTREFARELLSALWIKYYRLCGAVQAVSAVNHLTLGGVTADGGEATNDVTYLCLDVTAALGLNRPQVGVRVSKKTPKELLRSAVRCLAGGSGNPDFCNDEVIVPALVSIGVGLDDARDFSLSGCHEVIVTGKAQMGSVEGFVNMAKVVRVVLGLEPELGPGVDPERAVTWEQFLVAVTGVMKTFAQQAHEAALMRDSESAKAPGGWLNASLVTADCIEKAVGYTQGGARYNFCNWNVVGVANLADSLLSIQRLVFVERRLTLETLRQALASDWEGHETLRIEIVNAHAHYGNDTRDCDRMAASVIETFSESFARFTPFRGGRYILGTTSGGENMHTEFGMATGATPDGRRAGTTLADSIGPAQGRDRSGVTAMLNSVASLPHHLLPTATTLNVKLDPSILRTESGIDRIAGLIRAHFDSGGQQCQFNFVNRELLLKAREQPEQYGTIVVRVAGYSAPFSSLHPEIQDEIISRTMHAA